MPSRFGGHARDDAAQHPASWRTRPGGRADRCPTVGDGPDAAAVDRSGDGPRTRPGAARPRPGRGPERGEDRPDLIADRAGTAADDVPGLSLIHISEPTRRTPIS